MIVATEPVRHDLVIRIARSGRHVLVEKLLTASCDWTAVIVKACSDAKVVGSVIAQRRFDVVFEASMTYPASSGARMRRLYNEYMTARAKSA